MPGGSRPRRLLLLGLALLAAGGSAVAVARQDAGLRRFGRMALARLDALPVMVPGLVQPGGRRMTVTVADADQLTRALTTVAPGGTVRLRPGRYAPVRVRGRAFAGGVTITSDNPADPALLSGLQLIETRGVTLTDLAFDGSGPAEQFGLLVLRSSAVALDRLRFNDRSGTRRLNSAVMIRLSQDVKVTRLDVRGFWHGVSILDVERVEIARNEFQAIGTDAIRGGGGSGLLIRENVCYGFRTAPRDHPDCIQLWSTGQTRAASDIVIRDNLVVRGDGDPTQGVFVRDTFLTLPFRNVAIEGNMVVGGQYNGVTLSGATGSRVVGNAVLPYPDFPSNIYVRNVRDSVVADNVAVKLVQLESANNAVSRTRTVSPRRDQGAEIARWLAARPAMTAAAGPLLRRIMSERR